MATIGDGFKDVFLAGIGVMAITAEKSKELVNQFIARGEMTVEQGKQINTELKHKAEKAACAVRYDLLEAHMATMTAEERAAFARKAAEFAEKPYPAAEVGEASSVSVADPEGAEEAVAPQSSPDEPGAVPQTPGA